MRTRLMGVVNVTPDSFSDGGLSSTPEAAIAHGRELAADGADDPRRRRGIDSARARRRSSVEEEIARVEPVVARTRRTADRARGLDRHLEAGGRRGRARRRRDDRQRRHRPARRPEMAALCAERERRPDPDAHAGRPADDAGEPRYDDVVDEVRAFLAERLEAALAAGVAEERIWLDPGIGFGKTLEHNLELLRRLGELRELGRPLVVGTSRKSFIGRIDGSRGRRAARRHGRLLGAGRRRGRRRAPRPRRRRGAQAVTVAAAILG